MIRLEATKMFSLQRFNELTDITRKGNSAIGQIYIGDRFNCKYDLAKYLLDNQVVKVIEVIPEKE